MQLGEDGGAIDARGADPEREGLFPCAGAGRERGVQNFWWEALEVDPVTGLRVYSEVGLGLPRKNGKSVQASAAGLYFVVADGEAEPEVYVAAAARNQAGIVLGQSRRMAQQSPRLSRHVTVRTTLIECPRNGGIMRSLSADAALPHGLNPHANIIDELHAHRTAVALPVLEVQGRAGRAGHRPTLRATQPEAGSDPTAWVPHHSTLQCRQGSCCTRHPAAHTLGR